MDAFCRKPASSSIDPSIEAEVKMAMLIVQHNTFFNLSDHLTQFIKREFKGSEAAKNFSCGRTKTAAIVNCLGNHFFKKLSEDMKELPFSMMLDASNDTGLSKMYPVTIRIFDMNYNRIMTKFFDMNLLEGRDASTAAHQFQSVDQLLEKHEIPWSYCTAIGVDNTNANIGNRNSIKTRALEKNPTIKIAGCPCHIYTP